MKHKMGKMTAMLAAAAICVGLFSGCAPKEQAPDAGAQADQTQQNQEAATPGEPAEEGQTPAEKTDMNIALLKGPTGIGAVKLWQDQEDGAALNNYHFQLAGAPDEVVAKMVSGETDIAAVPANMAALLYQKTEGDVQVMAVNTLGVLYVLENGDTIQSVSDLSGKTIYATGQGATPEYVLDYILKANGVTDCTVEYLPEHAELAAKMAAGEAAIGLLPEPNVTALMMKNPEIRIALDMTKEWEAACEKEGKDGSKLTMGVLVANKKFAEEHKEAVNQFLDEYKASIQYVNETAPEAASLVEKFEIMPSAQAAEKAIPNCSLVYMDGEEMQAAVEGFLQVLFEANPKSIGGTLPDEAFYYKK